MPPQDPNIESDLHRARRVSTRKHLRGSALLLVGRGVGTALNFAAQVMVVRYLTKADYGAFAYALSLALFGSHVVGLGLAKGVNRYAPIYQERRQYDYMAGTVVLTLGAILGVGLALVLLVVGAVELFGTRLIDDQLALTLVMIVIVLAPLQAIDEITVKLFAIFASARAVFLRRHVLGPGLKLVAVAGLMAFRGDVVFLAYAYLVTGLLGTAISLVVIADVLKRQDLLRWFRPSQVRIPARAVLSYSLPLITSDIVTALRSTLVVAFLGFFHGAIEVAIFRSVQPVARLNTMVFDSFKLLFVPHASRMYAAGDHEGISELYWRTAAWITVVGFPVFVASFSLADPITVLLFGKKYADSGPILALVSLGLFTNSTFGCNTLVLRVFRKVRAMAMIDSAMIAVAVLANLVIVAEYGALGGAITSIALVIARNVLYQIHIVRLRVIRPPDAGFLLVAFTAFALAASLWLAQELLDLHIVAGGALAVLASLALLWVSAPRLAVRETFPELARVPAARRFLRIAEE